MALGLYFHIPFCNTKCTYCDFLSFEHRNCDEIETYTKYLLKEITLYKDIIKDRCVDSIYFGGGTPSLLSEKNIYDIMSSIYESFNVSDDSENTIEINPGNLKDSFFKNLVNSKINRASIGLETSNESLLRKLNRNTTLSQFLYTINHLKDNGINNISADLILGLPDNTISRELSDAKILIDNDIKHISAYSLILHKNTQLYNDIHNGRLNLPIEENERKSYHEFSDFVQSYGFIRYEISSFAKAGYESRHNKKYWSLEDYLAFGIGASAFYNGERRKNFSNLKYYYETLDKKEFPYRVEYVLSENDYKSEYAFLNIRTSHGINTGEFKKRFKQNFFDVFDIKKHIDTGLLLYENGKLTLTEKGIDLSNLVEVDFILD